MPALEEIKAPIGYKIWSHKDRFEHTNGPIFIHQTRTPEQGRGLLKFYAEKRHCNGGGAVHGGMLMTFADSAYSPLQGAPLRAITG